MEAGLYVGIDVSKARLDLALGATGELLNAANDASGIAALRERLLSLMVARVVLEASGGLETALVADLADFNVDVPRADTLEREARGGSGSRSPTRCRIRFLRHR